MQQGIVHHRHKVRIINIGMHPDGIVADAVVGRDRRAHSLRAVFREALHLLPRLKCHIRQQKSRSLRPLAASAVPTDLRQMSHG